MANEGTGTAVRPAWRREGTTYVVGVDGLTMDVIRPMAAEGELPNLARLASEGSSGPLATVAPTNSSLLWTTIATGCHHRVHGVDGFRYYQLAGARVSRSALRRMKKWGLKRVLQVLERRGWLKYHLLDGRHVRRKPFWDIFSVGGWRVGVVNWWHTWPAFPVNGFVVSDRLFHWRMMATINIGRPEGQLTYPESLCGELAPLTGGPQDVRPEQLRRFADLPDEEMRALLDGSFRRHDVRSELPYLVSLDTSCWRVFRRCLEAFPGLDAAAVYFRGPDIAQHCAFRYMPGSREPDVTEEDVRRFGRTVPEAYRLADEHVGEVMALMRPEDSLLVMSDHGFEYQAKRGKYGHARGRPPGVLYLLGKEFRAGQGIRGASIYDVMPTLLRVCGFPAARDMAGRCLDEALTDEFRAAHAPPGPVPTYGPRAPGRDLPQASERVDEGIQEHLRALGYLD